MIAANEAESPEEAREFARIIIEQAERMAAIVRQLLDFARRRRPEKGKSDLQELVRQSAALLAPLAARHRVSLEAAEAREPCLAEVDASQIQQVLTNLIVNAVQASAEGGRVTIEVGSAVHAPPDAPAGRQLPCALLRVRDQGVGIPEENLRAVFDPFFTTKEVGTGTGLGLSVAYGIVKEHGGWIELRSEPGMGSCFTVCLPVGGSA
jgi:signal transduction histidine kinase